MTCRTLSGLLALPLLLAAAGGCGKKSDGGEPGGSGAGPGISAELREVAGLLAAYSGETGRGPSRPADLARYELGFPLGYQAVQSGAIVVVWGARMLGEGEIANASDGVIAYEKKAPDEGGMVLLENGNIKQMSADQFKSAPKAR